MVAGFAALFQITFLFLTTLFDLAVGSYRHLRLHDRKAYDRVLLDIWDLRTLSKIALIGVLLGSGKLLIALIRDIGAFLCQKKPLDSVPALLILSREDDPSVRELMLNFRNSKGKSGPILVMRQWRSIQYSVSQRKWVPIENSKNVLSNPPLETASTDHVIYPGLNLRVGDPYAFLEATYLHDWLSERNVKRIYIAGASDPLQATAVAESLLSASYHVKWISHACFCEMPKNRSKKWHEVDLRSTHHRHIHDKHFPKDFENYHPEVETTHPREIREHMEEVENRVNKHIKQHHDTLKKQKKALSPTEEIPSVPDL